MRFSVVSSDREISSDAGRPVVYLVRSDWDDWFRFETLHFLIYRDDAGTLHNIGEVKIGQFDMSEGQRSPDLPETFERLGDAFFSVGQDGSYYENLNELGQQLRSEILLALHDLAADEDLYRSAQAEPVTTVSLLRAVTHTSIVGQFRRQARGGVRLSSYRFTYQKPIESDPSDPGVRLEFKVTPESEPPTNIHVLIGRNGVGKTHLLHHMTHAIVGETPPEADGETGSFSLEVGGEPAENFANVVSVSFSAFDRFEPIGEGRGQAGSVRYSYIGLKKVPRSRRRRGRPLAPKDPSALAVEFGTSVKECLQTPRLGRWQRALTLLAGDPIFADAGVLDLAADAFNHDGDDVRRRARNVFRSLSSGHKIVLLTVTRLVEKVEERSLVLLDEPEAHLHPPLLAAFVRALSDLLINRNGMAIVATHSPVVLQEVPKQCVWKLRRSGNLLVAEQPEAETFGENVGVLTREVFGLEVTRSGFHKLLWDAVAEGSSYEEIVDRFGGKLGGEAKALVRGLIVARDSTGGP